MRRPLQSPALINAFYDSLRPEQRETCMAMQRAILSVAPHLRPEVKWGNLCFMNEHDNMMAIALFSASILSSPKPLARSEPGLTPGAWLRLPWLMAVMTIFLCRLCWCSICLDKANYQEVWMKNYRYHQYFKRGVSLMA